MDFDSLPVCDAAPLPAVFHPVERLAPPPDNARLAGAAAMAADHGWEYRHGGINADGFWVLQLRPAPRRPEDAGTPDIAAASLLAALRDPDRGNFWVGEHFVSQTDRTHLWLVCYPCAG